MATNSTRVTKKSTAVPVAPEENAAAVEAVEEQVEPAVREYTLKDLDPHMYITVKNGFNGPLVYKSKKTGEVFKWEGFGDEQEMELVELKNAKNSRKTFFLNNWFLFDDPEVVEWLGVGRYYKHALNSKNFDELFTKSPAEIKKIVSELSDGQKSSVAFRARQMIQDHEIDSLKVIDALESALHVELIER